MAGSDGYANNPGTINIECPYCKAKPGNRCRPPGGIPGNRNNRPHAVRIAAAKKQREGESE